MQTNEHREVKAPTCLFLLRTVPSVGRRSTRLHHSGLPAAPVSEPGPWVSGPGIASPSAFSHSFGPSFGPPPSSRSNPAPPLAIPVFFQEGSCSDCAMLPPLSGFWLLPQAPLCLTWPRRYRNTVLGPRRGVSSEQSSERKPGRPQNWGTEVAAGQVGAAWGRLSPQSAWFYTLWSHTSAPLLGLQVALLISEGCRELSGPHIGPG